MATPLQISALPDDIWLGTEASYRALETAVEKLSDSATVIEVPKMRADVAVDENGFPKVMQQSGDIGVIAINGSLIPGYAGFFRLFGVLGYADIQDAMIEAVSNPDIRGILLDVSSGGGAVNGLQDTADLIANVDAVKPVVTYTGAMMASAAYWLGCSARQVMVADTGEAGSIGILAIHAERSKALAEDGIKVNVIRAGKYKALANPYEPLSDTARAQIQEKVDAMHALFKDHVANAMGLSSAQVNKVGQGQMFLGASAVEAGLANSVGNFSSAATLLRNEASKTANVRTSRASPVDKGSSRADNGPTQGTDDMLLTKEQLAALAAGTPLAEVLKMTPPAAADTGEKPAAAEEKPTEAAAEEKPTEAAAEEKSTEAAAEEKSTEAPKPVENVTAFLTAQLAEATAALIDAKATIKTMEASHAGDKAAITGLSAIVRASIGNMSVALGGAAEVAETLSGAELLAEHARIETTFKSKYKVGGVAATAPETKPTAAVLNPLFATLVAAVPAQ